MTSKQLTRIALALAVLVFFWGAAEILGKGSDKTTASFTLPALTVEDVDTVKVFRAADTIIVAKQGPGAWVVNGFDASEDVVSGLFGAMAGTTQAEVVAQNPASHAQLGVDSAGGKRLEFIKASQVLVSLVVGGRGPGYAGVYVRRPQENTVYLITNNLGNEVDRQLDDWRDKRVAAVEPDSVQEIRVQLRRGGYTLRHTDAGWSFPSGAKADSGAVRRMLEQYRSFLAAGFPTPAQEDSLDFRRPVRRMTLAGRSAPLAELVFDSTSAWWWVRRAGGGPTYKVESWRMPQLFPADSALKAK